MTDTLNRPAGTPGPSPDRRPVQATGRTGVARFFLGSVAGRVVASAPCPVLTVRGK